MARYRGPVEKLERRLGVSLALKGERRLAGKSALDNFALVTHLLYRRTNFHSSLLKIYSTFRLHQV